MDLNQIKEQMIDTAFWSGFAGSNGMVLLQAMRLADVNQWLHFGVLTVTLLLGFMKIYDRYKGKGGPNA